MKRAQQPNSATAVFQNAAVTIECTRKTTLAQLAEQLSALGEIHGKLTLPVYVRAAQSDLHDLIDVEAIRRAA
jgi:hypothetical protein